MSTPSRPSVADVSSSSSTGGASPTLLITPQDMERLRAVVDAYGGGSLSEQADALELELDRAQVVSQQDIPPDVVTMRARVQVEETATGKQRELILVYPNEAEPGGAKVSVLAPVGAAILGMKVGDQINWPLPNGRTTTLRILNVLYQPEAAGHLEL